MFCNSNVNKTVFLVSLKYREIITIKTVTLHEKLFFFIRSVRSKKKKLALTSFYYVNEVIQKSLFA